jgi:hypothetical protein
MLAVMTWRSAHRDGYRQDAGRIPVLAAILGLAWNAGALVVFGSEDFGLGSLSPWFTMIAYGALGFLPAVVVDAATRAPHRSGRPSVVAIVAYALSAAAALLQAVSTVSNGVVSSIGLLTLTLGYGGILLALAITTRRRAGSHRALTAVALAAFAVSALHLSRHSAASDSWIVELIGHHASLPLVLVILYQDYRFALADLFLKRAIALLGLVALVVSAYALLSTPLAGHSDITLISLPSVLLVVWVATAVAFPVIRSAVDRFVDRIILRREDLRILRSDIGRAVAGTNTPDDALRAAGDGLRNAFNASRATWDEQSENGRDPGDLVTLGSDSADVWVPTADSPHFRIHIAGLPSGRRVLSDDLVLMDAVGLLVARRIDELRVSRERFERDVREYEMQRLAAEAELRALRAQLNPHFLFNALTTIGHLIRESPARAVETLYQLTALLRGALRQTSGEFVTLGDELQLVDAYLSIEQARFEDRLRIERAIAPETTRITIPPLILQPLVENAIKHAIAQTRTGGVVRIEAFIDSGKLRDGKGRGEGEGEVLRLRVRDSGEERSEDELLRQRRAGVGLTNIEHRLARYYNGRAAFTLVSGPAGTVAELAIPIPPSAAYVHATVDAPDMIGGAGVRESS